MQAYGTYPDISGNFRPHTEVANLPRFSFPSQQEFDQKSDPNIDPNHMDSEVNYAPDSECKNFLFLASGIQETQERHLPAPSEVVPPEPSTQPPPAPVSQHSTEPKPCQAACVETKNTNQDMSLVMKSKTVSSTTSTAVPNASTPPGRTFFHAQGGSGSKSGSSIQSGTIPGDDIGLSVPHNMPSKSTQDSHGMFLLQPRHVTASAVRARPPSPRGPRTGAEAPQGDKASRSVHVVRARWS